MQKHSSPVRSLVLGLAMVAAMFGLSYAVSVTGTNSTNENSVFKVGYVRYSVTDGIVANAGGGLANATLLDSAYNRVTTVATANDSVKLPSCHTGASNTGGQLPPGVVSGNTTGMMLYVTNATTNSMNVFPQTNESINALSANSAYAMAAGKSSAFLCSPAGTIWYSILGG